MSDEFPTLLSIMLVLLFVIFVLATRDRKPTQIEIVVPATRPVQVEPQ